MIESELELKIERWKWEVLKQLKNDSIIDNEYRYFRYEVKSGTKNTTYPSPDNQIKIIKNFELKGMLEIKSRYYILANGTTTDNELWENYGFKPISLLLELKQKTFDRVFTEYEKKFPNENDVGITNKGEFYITKDNENYYYKGKLLKISDNYPCNVFLILFDICGEDGFITYKDFGKEIRDRIPRKNKLTEKEMQKFIQQSITDKNNGFTHCVKIPLSISSQRKLFKAIPRKGIEFNNRIK